MKQYFVQTFGCQMNVHDSRRIEEVLLASGFREASEPALADLLVVNTCSVREKAEHKLMSLLGTFRPFKEARPGLVLAVAGCVAQQEGDAFKPGYLKILAYGGSARPEAILREAGIDMTDPSFWQGGFDVIREMIDELESIPLD